MANAKIPKLEEDVLVSISVDPGLKFSRGNRQNRSNTNAFLL